MDKILNFEGLYRREGGSYTQENPQSNPQSPIRVIVGVRKETTQKKTKQFILYSYDGSRPKYWSSLYPVDGNQYWAEHGGKEYQVTLKTDSIEIRKGGQDG